MKIEDLINEMSEVIQESRSFPFMGGKTLIDPDRLLGLIDDVRANLPQEVRQAKAIVADRSQIIADAKKEAETIVRNAEERRKAMVSDSEIVRQARINADEIVSDAKMKSREVRKAANDYVEEIMRKADEMLTANVNELRKTRQSIKASQRQGS